LNQKARIDEKFHTILICTVLQDYRSNNIGHETFDYSNNAVIFKGLKNL